MNCVGASTRSAERCREVASWLNSDGTRGFKMACGEIYDAIEPADPARNNFIDLNVCRVRAGHVCRPVDDLRPKPLRRIANMQATDRRVSPGAKVFAGAVLFAAGLIGGLFFITPPSFGQVFVTALVAVGLFDLVGGLARMIWGRSQ